MTRSRLSSAEELIVSFRNPYAARPHDRDVANISVIATSPDGTRAALRTAAQLGSRGVGKLWLFVRAEQSGQLPRGPDLNDATILMYSGHEEDLLQLISRAGPIVVGGRAGLWWPTPEQQLARKFAQLGYRVIFARVQLPTSALSA
jgi:hypothetical protein